jgi:predicted amidohydrolase
MRCVLLQCEPHWQDLPASRAALAAQMDEAGDLRGALVITPEMAESGFSMHPERACDGHSASFAQAQATARGCFLLHGFVERHAAGFRNVVALLDPSGREQLRYAKNHLFSPAGEPRAYVAGDSIALASVGGLRLSTFICYDLRFPELWRLAALERAELLTLSACWPSVRQAHWRALAIARAIENQAFVLACNRVGQEPNAHYTGGSLIVAPDGEVLAEAGSVREVLSAEVDPDRVRTWRERFPALKDLRRSRLGQVSTVSSGDSAGSR